MNNDFAIQTSDKFILKRHKAVRCSWVMVAQRTFPILYRREKERSLLRLGNISDKCNHNASSPFGKCSVIPDLRIMWHIPIDLLSLSFVSVSEKNVKSTKCWHCVVKSTGRSFVYFWHRHLISPAQNLGNIRWSICQAMKLVSISAQVMWPRPCSIWSDSKRGGPF